MTICFVRIRWILFEKENTLSRYLAKVSIASYFMYLFTPQSSA